jgi:hypothetical protein
MDAIQKEHVKSISKLQSVQANSITEMKQEIKSKYDISEANFKKYREIFESLEEEYEKDIIQFQYPFT